jgi:anti-sigma regulatory factor (Ser/Thr protein kinase)
MVLLGRITLPGVARSAGRGRAFLRETLDTDHPALPDLEVCVSELITNARCHTDSGRGGRIVVTLSAGAGVVRVEVTDDGADGARPRIRAEDDGEDCGEHGRGMRIVEALSARWGFEEDGARTTVWAEFPSGSNR